jgi:four helix bundle protein
MATYKSFEELKMWQSSRELNQVLFEVISGKDDKNFGFLINHLYKTGGSIMDNIAEGHGRQGNKEFINFLSYSTGSCTEIRSQFYRAMDFGLITQADFDKLSKISIDVLCQISYFTNYLKKSELKGNKFR